MKVWLYKPLDIRPEFQTSGPVCRSLVLLCSARKFHRTVSPGATVTGSGEKLKPGPTLTLTVAHFMRFLEVCGNPVQHVTV